MSQSRSRSFKWKIKKSGKDILRIIKLPYTYLYLQFISIAGIFFPWPARDDLNYIEKRWLKKKWLSHLLTWE